MATQILDDTIEQLDLIDIFGILHTPPQKKPIIHILSSVYGIFPRIDPILGRKTNLKKCKRIAIISNIFSGHNGMKLGISHRKRNEKKNPIT